MGFEPARHQGLCCRNRCLHTCIWKRGTMFSKIEHDLILHQLRYVSPSARNMCTRTRNREHFAIGICPQICTVHVFRHMFLQHVPWCLADFRRQSRDDLKLFQKSKRTWNLTEVCQSWSCTTCNSLWGDSAGWSWGTTTCNMHRLWHPPPSSLSELYYVVIWQRGRWIKRWQLSTTVGVIHKKERKE